MAESMTQTQAPQAPQPQTPQPPILPRVAITYCTQCRWLLRAAYYAQELLSTFSTTLGEVALQPSTGGKFTVHLTHTSQNSSSSEAQEILIWDRKAEGGFPETKILKQRVRNLVEPERDLGHSDTPAKKAKEERQEGDGKGTKAASTLEGDVVVDGGAGKGETTKEKEKCEDCA